MAKCWHWIEKGTAKKIVNFIASRKASIENLEIFFLSKAVHICSWLSDWIKVYIKIMNPYIRNDCIFHKIQSIRSLVHSVSMLTLSYTQSAFYVLCTVWYRMFLKYTCMHAYSHDALSLSLNLTLRLRHSHTLEIKFSPIINDRFMENPVNTHKHAFVSYVWFFFYFSGLKKMRTFQPAVGYSHHWCYVIVFNFVNYKMSKSW